ncbi:MAG: hypothetical protein AAF890_09990 [Pseudomonadota bacterium]
MMKIKAGLVAAFLGATLVGTPVPTSAQNVDLKQIGTSGNWRIKSMTVGRKHQGCVAEIDNASATLQIMKSWNKWYIATPYYGNDDPNWDVGLSNGDGRVVMFTNSRDGWATLEFNADSLRRDRWIEIYQGSRRLRWSLNGSSAAMDMVQRCDQNNGSLPASQQSNAFQKPRSWTPQQRQQFRQAFKNQKVQVPARGEIVVSRPSQAWTVYAGRDERGGLYCAVEAARVQGSLRIAYTLGQPLRLNGQSYRYVLGVKYNTALPPSMFINLDGNEYSLTTAPTLRGWVGAPIADPFVNSLAGGTNLAFEVGGYRESFGLSGSSRAISFLRACPNRIQR